MQIGHDQSNAQVCIQVDLVQMKLSDHMLEQSWPHFRSTFKALLGLYDFHLKCLIEFIIK